MLDRPADRALRTHRLRRLALVRGDAQLRQRQALARVDHQRRAGRATTRAMEIGLARSSWLVGLQRAPRGHFRPIGSNGFYARRPGAGRFRSTADRGPGDRLRLHRSLSRHRRTLWLNEARLAFDWFLGRNDLGEEFYDSAPAAAATACRRTGPIRTRAPSRRSPSCCRWPRCNCSKARSPPSAAPPKRPPTCSRRKEFQMGVTGVILARSEGPSAIGGQSSSRRSK